MTPEKLKDMDKRAIFLLANDGDFSDEDVEYWANERRLFHGESK